MSKGEIGVFTLSHLEHMSGNACGNDGLHGMAAALCLAVFEEGDMFWTLRWKVLVL